MDATKFPFREKLYLSKNFSIVHYHNNDHSDGIYQLTQKEYSTNPNDEKQVWFVMAQFKFVSELLTYLKDFNFDE